MSTTCVNAMGALPSSAISGHHLDHERLHVRVKTIQTNNYSYNYLHYTCLKGLMTHACLDFKAQSYYRQAEADCMACYLINMLASTSNRIASEPHQFAVCNISVGPPFSVLYFEDPTDGENQACLSY